MQRNEIKSILQEVGTYGKHPGYCHRITGRGLHFGSFIRVSHSPTGCDCALQSNGRIGIRKGLVYPRHFSLPLKRTTCPLQLTVEAAAVGNLAVRIKLVGSAALSGEHVQSLVRVGGWNNEAVARAVDEVGILLQGSG